MLHALVPDATDGWEHALEHAGQYFARVARSASRSRALAGSSPSGRRLGAAAADLDAAAREAVGAYLEAARTLGHQTAALHLALARGTDEALAPQPMTAEDVLVARGGHARTREPCAGAVWPTGRRCSTRPQRERADASSRRSPRCSTARRAGTARLNATKTRCHQDYHLGQLLWTGARYALLDFEGEPARPLTDRRRKRSPLTDVAGMLRSYSYAAWSASSPGAAHTAPTRSNGRHGRRYGKRRERRIPVAYLADTRGASFIPRDGEQVAALLELLMIDKALYELDYELNNRPDWLPVPIEGLLRLRG